MNVVCATYFLCGIMEASTGALRGIGASMTSMFTSLFGSCVFRVAWIFTVFKALHTPFSLFISYPISWAMTGGVQFIFFAIFAGYNMGVQPLFSYHFGAENRPELKNLFRKSMILLGAFAAAMTAAALLLARPLSAVFVGYDQALMDMTVRGFVIYSLSFLLCGFNIFGSSLFTALNNGLISAVISFVRTLICQIAAVLLLPLILGLDGIWWAIVVSEGVALILTVFCFIKLKNRYHYL
jgi:Na+-driven multidrug efflux pump